MKKRGTSGFVALAGTALAAGGLAAGGLAAEESPPTAVAVATGVWRVPGGIRPDRQPDGNSVVFATPQGLVVVDTGRHDWHREAILELARAQGRPIVAIVNSHWHLDHVSGNPALRAAHPGLRVLASDAIDAALTGFLAASAKDSAQYLADPQVPAPMREDIRADLASIENGAALRPDEVVTASGPRPIGGRRFELRLARHAATAGDVWLYDEASLVAVLGDLITLPAPFLDTACPEGWKAALAEVSATPFEVAIPGHGPPMSRAQVEQYRAAFTAFVDCSATTRPAADCAGEWADSIAPLLAEPAAEKPQAREYAEYYAGLLRANGGKSEHCEKTGGKADR